MPRFCYVSKILPGKSDTIRNHWKTKLEDNTAQKEAEDADFWKELKMTGFESFLQPTPVGDFMIHCLEGESLEKIFEGLRKQITANNKIALNLANFYQNTLGKDYQKPEAEPEIEFLLDVHVPTNLPQVKKAFFYPILADKVEAHRQFRKDSNGEKKMRHEASMKAFNVSHLSVWLQKVGHEYYSVVYTERRPDSQCDAAKRLERGMNSPEWQEIAKTLQEHTGLSHNELSPNVEWLTQH